MSGLFAARSCGRSGWDADVYERSTIELVGRGAGITTHPELLQALESSGAGTRDLGIEVGRRIVLDRTGRAVAEKRLPQILTSWDRLQRLFRETIDPAHYHLGWNFEHVEQNGSGVRVHFSGGRAEHGDVLVGGDGVRSGVRAAIQPEVQPIYAGYYIWLGLAVYERPSIKGRQWPGLRHMPRIRAARSTVTPPAGRAVELRCIGGGHAQTSNSLTIPAGIKRVREA